MHLDPATLETIRHALQLVRLTMFAGFVALGVRILRTRDGARRRGAINHFIIYTLLAHVAILVPQNEAWPFTLYPMMSTDATARTVVHSGVALGVIDEAGHEWRVDGLAWGPLFPQSVMGWFEVTWPRASASERREVLRFLLARAERARETRQDGRRFFGNASILGPLAAPDTNLWGTAPQSPAHLRALRVYRVSWNPVTLVRSGQILERKLIDEYQE